jgi:hypothetical protein
MKYKRLLKSTTGQATAKYEKWSWSRHLEFLDYTLTSRPTTSNVSHSQISETPLQGAAAPPPSEDTESTCSLSPASLEMPPPPIKKKLKKRQSTDDIDKVIGYLENKKKNKNQLDRIDYLFLNYAETFKQFPPRKETMLKLELATLFARFEISELDVQTTQASSPHSANSTGSGHTSDESNAPQDSAELKYTELSEAIDLSKYSITNECGKAYLLVQPK